MSNQGLGPELRFGQRPRRSLYADDLPEDDERVAGLFNAAWYEVARGSWADAEETLARLLALAPDDGEALVLLAKVHVARGRLAHALEALDSARDVGWPVDPNLREAIVSRVGYDPQAELADDATPSVPAPGVKDAVAARQRSFHLRQDNEQLQQRIAQLEREIRRWIFATMGVCVTATGIVTWALVPPVPRPDLPPARQAVASVLDSSGMGLLRTVPAPQSPLATLADRVVPGIRTALTAHNDDGVVIANGELADYRERQAIEAIWLELPEVRRVDWSGVTVTSRIVGGRVQVQPGDTLSGLAFRYYGDPGLAQTIAKANEITAKGLRPGQFLAIPPAP
ncbi:MAG: LysM peptidoglycan-binding domain-containing protein [Myxococcota bacterium]